MYKHPGVYIEDIPSGLLAIEASSTSTAVFVAAMPRGPLGEPVQITSLAQYVEGYGSPWGSAIWPRPTDKLDAVGQAVSAFFANGGSKAYILRLGKPVNQAPDKATDDLGSPFKDDTDTIKLTIKEAAAWAGDFAAVLTPVDKADPGKGVVLSIGIPRGELGDVQSLADIDVYESFAPLSLKADAANFAGKKVDSKVFAIEAGAAAAQGPNDTLDLTKVQPAAVKDVDNDDDYDAAFTTLRDYRDVSIIVLPGVTWNDAGKTTIQAAITHAESMKNRMVIVDPPHDQVLGTASDVSDLGADTSPFAALYYPWLKVPNPYYDAELAPGLPRTLDVAPSGFAAGLWARIDATRGVWKAPAGLEATVRGTLGPVRPIGNDIQDNINELGINVIRSVIGPTVVWGARTLATKTKPEFRYISVRRTQSMIGESLYGALQAVVFEPNDHKLWASLRGSVGDFMNGLYRAGAFQGEKASDAYFVQCGLGTTMTQADIDAGKVIVAVGFAPLKPAEFVIVQIQQIVGQRG